MLISGMPLISGCGMTGGVVTVQHKLVYSELQGKRTCPVRGVHGASVGPQKIDGILVRMLKRLPLLGLVYLRESIKRQLNGPLSSTLYGVVMTTL